MSGLPSLPVLALLLAITLAASLLQGLSGFGFPLFAVPLFSLLLPVRFAVPVVTVLSLLSNLLMIRDIPAIRSRKKEALSLFLASYVTIPLGVLCLAYLDTSLIKVFIGGASVLCALLMMRGLRVDIKKPLPWSVGVGLVCGFLAGLASMAGPPLVLYLNNLNLDKKTFRGFAVFMFAVMGVFSLGNAIFNGLVGGATLLLALVLSPALLAGILLGGRYAAKIKEDSFRKLTLVLLMLSSLSALVSGLMGLAK